MKPEERGTLSAEEFLTAVETVDDDDALARLYVEWVRAGGGGLALVRYGRESDRFGPLLGRLKAVILGRM